MYSVEYQVPIVQVVRGYSFTDFAQLGNAVEYATRACLLSLAIRYDGYIGVNDNLRLSKRSLGGHLPLQCCLAHSRNLTELVSEEVLGPIGDVPELVNFKLD